VFDGNFEKSYASTNDYNCIQPVTVQWEPTKPAAQSPNQFEIRPELICVEWRTTLMIRNIPNKYTVNELAEEIDS
jgi:hypothetical protein